MIKLKLTCSEMLTLISIVNAGCTIYNNMMLAQELNMEHKLYKALLDTLHLDLQRKALIWKKVYPHILKPEQAIAFYLVFNKAKFGGDEHSANVARQLCHKIHKQYA